MKNQKVLIVEDENDIRELIHFHLYRNQYEVLEATSGSQAFDIIKDERPDLVLLDIMIPEMDGLELCQKVKNDTKTAETKIIFISAKGSEEDIVKGLELGAEDYITKPFSPKILVARVKTVLKRGLQAKPSEDLNYYGIVINLEKRKVLIDDSDINLTMTEFELLKYLMSSPGQVFTRSQIVNKIKGQNHAVTDRSVDTQLVSLRKKMGEKGSLIETVWGIGYRFKENEN